MTTYRALDRRRTVGLARRGVSRRGFTLLEVIVLLMCLALLAAGAVALFSDLQAVRSSDARAEVESLVNLAQRLARAKRQAVDVLFDPANQVCGVRRADDGRNWLEAPAGGGPLALELATETVGGLRLKGVFFGGGKILKFDNKGVPASGGYLSLEDAAKKTYRLDVNNTGYTSWKKD